MPRPPLLKLSASLALLTAVGCGSSDAQGPAAATPAVCEAPGYHVDSSAIRIETVHASIVLPSGEAASELPVQVCGLNVCNLYNALPNGELHVEPRTMMVLPALKYGDGFDFAELAAPLSELNEDVGTLVALPLPSYAEGAKFPEPGGGTVTNGDLTLHLDANVSIEHDLLSYSDDSELVFRSVPVPVAESPQALPPSFGFELAYGLAPLGTTFCPAAKLSLPNSLNWPPGSEIEVFVQGLDVAEKWAPYATWQPVAEARVSANGKSIDTTSGGIPILSSIALRRK
ncbi:MAG TPA: hypothetical protein VFK05_18815 [Polyangiaceae bacterium]|nr:hypothetical protein [Polyangiaceae bacterium]